MDYSSYTPIDPDFYDTIKELSERHPDFKVFFFLPDQKLGEANGEYQQIKKSENGEFMMIKDSDPVRIDRIITVNGKPGPAYAEYNAYADACLSCQAGYDEEKEEGDN
jgi:hypothetical protein